MVNDVFRDAYDIPYMVNIVKLSTLNGTNV